MFSLGTRFVCKEYCRICKYLCTQKFKNMQRICIKNVGYAHIYAHKSFEKKYRYTSLFMGIFHSSGRIFIVGVLNLKDIRLIVSPVNDSNQRFSGIQCTSVSTQKCKQEQKVLEKELSCKNVHFTPEKFITWFSVYT